MGLCQYSTTRHDRPDRYPLSRETPLVPVDNYPLDKYRTPTVSCDMDGSKVWETTPSSFPLAHLHRTNTVWRVDQERQCVMREVLAKHRSDESLGTSMDKLVSALIDVAQDLIAQEEAHESYAAAPEKGVVARNEPRKQGEADPEKCRDSERTSGTDTRRSA